MADNEFCLIDCSSALEFLHELDETHRRWRGRTWIYRGQNDARWGLLPPSFRLDFSYDYVRKYWGRDSLPQMDVDVQVTDADRKDPRKYDRMSRFRHVATEQRLVEAFLMLADRCGLSIPYENVNSASVIENIIGRYNLERLHKEHQNMFSAVIYPDSVEYALAQHHRIPTRLLDFTYRPLVAAYFAASVEGKPAKIPPDLIIVWAVSLGSIQSTSLRIVRHRRTQIGFLQAQDGLFLYDERANEKCEEHDTWQPYETELKSNGRKPRVFRLTLPFTEREVLLNLLRLKHVTKPLLMPSFDNVAQEIREFPEFWNELTRR